VKKLVFGLALVFSVIPCQARIITVDDNGPADFNNIQAAINDSWDGDRIEVRTGTYYENVYFYGKAITLTGTDPNDPNIVAQTIIDGNRADSVVTFAWGEGPDSVINGFTITNGKAPYGGGIYCWSASSPTITNCVITNNVASGEIGTARCGAGIYGGLPTIIHCSISGNSAVGFSYGGGLAYCNGYISACVITNNTVDGDGGGLYQCYATIQKCLIANNYAGGEWHGRAGGAGLYACNGQIIECTISGNRSSNKGGGLNSCNGTKKNCVIVGNMALEYGGGLYNCKGRIENCVISSNLVRDLGGGIYNDDYGGSPLIKNNIIYSNTGGGIYWKYTQPLEFSCCDAWNNAGGDYTGWAMAGKGCISNDPCFINPGYWVDISNPNVVIGPNEASCWYDQGFQTNVIWTDKKTDYHLKSEAGRWDPNQSIWVYDVNTSTCIDAGDPNSDWTAELWPHGKRINMGAYGGTPQASMSLSDVGNIADLNNDGLVDYVDLMLFTYQWSTQQFLLSEDLNRNGKVDFSDFAIFADNWLWP